MAQGNYANVNGLRLYYEIVGSGNPLMLLHGLVILPGTTHYDIISSPALVAAVIPFLDAPMPHQAA